MTKRKDGSKTKQSEPDQLRPRMIFVRTTVALYEDATEVAERLGVSLSVLAGDALARLVKSHKAKADRKKSGAK